MVDQTAVLSDFPHHNPAVNEETRGVGASGEGGVGGGRRVGVRGDDFDGGECGNGADDRGGDNS